MLGVGLVAVVCLSSTRLAAIVGGATAVLVAIDMIARARQDDAEPPTRAPSPQPDKLIVDVDRARRRP